jgi:hypothetical protein
MVEMDGFIHGARSSGLSVSPCLCDTLEALNPKRCSLVRFECIALPRRLVLPASLALSVCLHACPHKTHASCRKRRVYSQTMKMHIMLRPAKYFTCPTINFTSPPPPHRPQQQEPRKPRGVSPLSPECTVCIITATRTTCGHAGMRKLAAQALPERYIG